MQLVISRKRLMIVDPMGFLPAIVVLAESVDDGTSAPEVLRQLDRELFPWLRKLWADQKYNNRTSP